MGYIRTATKLSAILAVAAFMSGCVMTKLVTVPMRVGGAITSVVPVAGDVSHKAIDTTADAIDLLPF